jgi:flavin reductase (DIM6/NTAB) family NADH-FMN oxidoreductase RutF
VTGSPGSLAVLAGTFREVMAGVCTPVAVVTTMAESGPYGTTVSAFSSLSLSPPMVMVALDERSELLRLLAVGSPLGVNVLRSGQSALARVFARKGPDKFSGVAWDLDAGAPRLDGGAGWLGGSVSRLVAGGDHVIVLAEVLRADPGNGEPLTYHARTFGTHVAAAG